MIDRDARSTLFCDAVSYRGEEYSILKHHGAGMPDPHSLTSQTHGTFAIGSMEWDATYVIDDDGMRLIELDVRGTETLQPIGETWPVRIGPSSRYKGLALPIPFTGVLMLAKDPIFSGYGWSAYHQETQYGVVLDLVLVDGRLICVSDRSEEMRERRSEALPRPRRKEAML